MNNKRRTNEKPKNFKESIIRLIKELSGFKLMILVSIILSIISSIISLVAPSKLKDLTNYIQESLVPNTNNITELSKEIITNSTDLNNNIIELLDITITEKTINNVLISKSITSEEKEIFKSFLVDRTNPFMLPLSVLSELVNTTTYKDTTISKEDKIIFIKELQESSVNYPNTIKSILLDDLTYKNIHVSSSDQIDFLYLLKDIDNTKGEELLKKLDLMPSSIKKIASPKNNLNLIKRIALILIIMYICSALFNYLETILMALVSNRFAKKLRCNMTSKINRLPLSYFDHHQTGDILSIITNDIDTMSHNMDDSITTLISSIALFLGSITMMFITNSILAVTAITSSLFGFIFMSIVLSKSQKYFNARQKEIGALNGHIEEVYSGLNVVKTYNGIPEANRKFDEYNEKVYVANKMSRFLSGLMMPMMSFVGDLGYVCVCIVGALLTMKGTITFGVIIAFISYVKLFTSPLSQIAQAMTSLQTTLASSERVFAFMDEIELSNEESLNNSLDINSIKGNIEFNNVTFKYDDNDTETIKNFSAKVKSGEKIAIVGPTGAGKTTMVNLLMKFYEISSGDILIDGVSINNLKRENIRDMFTMVLQDTWLFEGTIKENLIYNKKGVTDEEVEEVCKIVGLDHFIKTLPNGYDTVIEDNNNISAGQKQLLTIARGMIKNAPLLILDEATSNVDTRTEELVAKAMDKLTKGKTSFIIAHRLSTIKNANLILVMNNGNIIEQGTHQELLNKNGFYASLYNSQFKL